MAMTSVAPTSDTPLAVEGVSVAYGDMEALSTVTLHLEAGVTALLGPNGAGKTTLFRVGAGILPPDDGTVRVAGRDPFADPAAKAAVGYLGHGPALDGRRSVRANLDFWGRAAGLDAEERERRTADVAERFAFADLLDRPGDALSRGQRQRVALGRALLHDPAVLFLDEPTSGLDPTTADRLRAELADLATDRALLYATHHLHEAAALADRIAFLRDGRVIEHDDVEQLRAETGLSDERLVAVEAGETAEASLRALGYDPRREDDAWVVSLREGEEPADVVAALVDRDVEVSGVRRVEADLNDIYRRLEGRR